MKKAALFLAFALLFSFSQVHADDSKASLQDVYDLVLKAYEVVGTLGEESFPAFNDPKGEFVYKDTYVFIERCPSEMMAHPFALEKLKGIDLDKTFAFNKSICGASATTGGSWIEYRWPKPGEKEPSRKVSFVIGVDGTPYTVVAGIYNDSDKVENLNKTLR